MVPGYRQDALNGTFPPWGHMYVQLNKGSPETCERQEGNYEEGHTTGSCRLILSGRGLGKAPDFPIKSGAGSPHGRCLTQCLRIHVQRGGPYRAIRSPLEHSVAA